ncbi:MAG TPA: adenosine-specific kinase [Candidatus Binataceae bacterium]|nr:adenosine-specific kinase [Candidatus Binataceae bacterium]
MELKTISVMKPDSVNLILGQTHFIKSVEDLYEAVVQAVPGVKFGVAFCEASGPCLIRHTGTDAELEKLAIDAAAAIGAGHVFVIMLGNIFPINVLNQIKSVAEVCGVFCATANPVRVVVACEGEDRGVLGVIDGSAPKGIEGEKEQGERRAMLRRFGYKQ